MEQRPRFGQEQPGEDDDERSLDEQPRRFRSMGEGYWAKLLGESEVPEEEKNKDDEDDDEEEDEDDDEKSKVTKSADSSTEKVRPKEADWIDRFKIIKKDLNRNLLPDNDDLDDKPEVSSAEVAEPAPVEDRLETPVVEAEEVPARETAADVLPPIDLPPTDGYEVDDNNDVPEFIDASELRPAAEIESDTEPALAETPAAVDTEPDPPHDELESLDTILRRQAETYPPAVVEAGREAGAGAKPEVQYRPIVNTGLHLLNHGVALRRRNKDMARIKTEFKKAKAEIDELKKKKDQQREFALQEIQHAQAINNEIKPDGVPEPITSERSKTETIVEKTMDRTDEVNKNIENIEQTKQELAQKIETLEVKIPQTATEQARAEFLRHANELSPNYGLAELEAQFDRQHELHNRQEDSLEIGQMAMVDNIAAPKTDEQKIYSTATEVKGLDKVWTKEPKNDYQQAIVSGAWGAVVGIIVFIIFYILANR